MTFALKESELLGETADSRARAWRSTCQSGGAPALRPGAIAQSPGREAALAWASLAQRFKKRDHISCQGSESQGAFSHRLAAQLFLSAPLQRHGQEGKGEREGMACALENSRVRA